MVSNYGDTATILVQKLTLMMIVCSGPKTTAVHGITVIRSLWPLSLSAFAALCMNGWSG